MDATDEDRTPRVEVIETWSPRRFSSRHAQTLRVLGATLLLALLVAPLAIAGPSADTSGATRDNFTKPVKITPRAAADYALQVRNEGRGARILCTKTTSPCLYVFSGSG